MFDKKLLDEMNARISEVIAASPAKDIEKNMKAMLSAMFTRMDLVTRDEFETQVKVLQRTREKLEQLEAKLAQQQAAASASIAPSASASTTPYAADPDTP